MPFPNFHSARVRDPGDFDPNTFRTKSLSDGVTVIMGKLKGGDSMTAQTYRFSADKFTAAEAKEWLKKNDVKDYKFEAASGKEEKSAATNYERRIMPAKLSELRMMACESNPQKRMIVGYAARFYDGSPGSQCVLKANRDGSPKVVERIMPQAFDNDLLQNLGGTDIIATFNHDPNMMLGRRSNGTLRAACDHAGMRYEIDPPDTQYARDVSQLIDRGDVHGSSFGFDCRSDAWSKDGDCVVRMLKDVAIRDLGPVAEPAYAGTSVGMRAVGDAEEAIRSMQEWEEREVRAAIAAASARARVAEVSLRVMR